MKKGNLGVGLVATEGEEMSEKQQAEFAKFLEGHVEGEECRVTLVHGGEEGADEKAHWISTDYYCDKIIIPSNEDREEYWTGKACCSQTTILDIEADKKKRLGMIISRAKVLLLMESEDRPKTLAMKSLIGEMNRKKKEVIEIKR